MLFLQLDDEQGLSLLTLIPHTPELLVHLEEVEIVVLGIMEPVIGQAPEHYRHTDFPHLSCSSNSQRSKR